MPINRTKTNKNKRKLLLLQPIHQSSYFNSAMHNLSASNEMNFYAAVTLPNDNTCILVMFCTFLLILTRSNLNKTIKTYTWQNAWLIKANAECKTRNGSPLPQHSVAELIMYE